MFVQNNTGQTQGSGQTQGLSLQFVRNNTGPSVQNSNNIIKNRKQNRLDNYDYSQNGMYFITICTRGREELFGEIKNVGTNNNVGTDLASVQNNKIMILNELGTIVKKYWLNLPEHYKNCILDEWIIMPNHIHGIIEINNNAIGQTQGSGQTQGLSLPSIQNNTGGIGLLSRIIQEFKSRTTVEYIKLMKLKNEPYSTKIWQRSFYDHIIRDEKSLNKIREYIQINPKIWERDRNNLGNVFM